MLNGPGLQPFGATKIEIEIMREYTAGMAPDSLGIRSGGSAGGALQSAGEGALIGGAIGGPFGALVGGLAGGIKGVLWD